MFRHASRSTLRTAFTEAGFTDVGAETEVPAATRGDIVEVTQPPEVIDTVGGEAPIPAEEEDEEDDEDYDGDGDDWEGDTSDDGDDEYDDDFDEDEEEPEEE